MTRYNNVGQIMMMGEDKGPFSGGPLWIWTPMEYASDEKKTTLTVRSPTMKTPTDYWIKASAGFHYCKILSPAKAMEWIYVDSLKARMSL